MNDKGLDFKHKEVIDINNGKRLGYVQDVCADFQTKFLSLFSNNNDIIIPWEHIHCIGEDLILVEI